MEKIASCFPRENLSITEYPTIRNVTRNNLTNYGLTRRLSN